MTEIHRSNWITIDQPMIDRFAEATLDHQFIHIDPVRASETPFGGTIVHGFLMLSLLPHLLESADNLIPPEAKMVMNYGFDRIRFIHPVRSGSRIRGIFVLTDRKEKRPGQFQQSLGVTVEIEGVGKPALTAVWLSSVFS